MLWAIISSDKGLLCKWLEQVYNCDTRLRQCTKATQEFRSNQTTRRKASKTFLKNGKLLGYHNLQTIAEYKVNGRFCFTQTEYTNNLKAVGPTKSRNKNICYMCGGNTYSMCNLCKVPLCVTASNSKKRDSNGDPIQKFCHSNYHNYEWFGLGRSDCCSRIRNDKRVRDSTNWKPQSNEELKDNTEYMKFLLDIEDEEETYMMTKTRQSDDCNTVIPLYLNSRIPYNRKCGLAPYSHLPLSTPTV